MKWVSSWDYPWLLVCTSCGHCIGEHGEDECPACHEKLETEK